MELREFESHRAQFKVTVMYNHQVIIRQFIKDNPGYRTSGLSKYLRKKFPEDETGIAFKKIGYIPDAFMILDDCVHLLEVDKSSILDHKKLWKVLNLWHDLDCLSCRMEMIIISGYTLATSIIDDWQFARLWNDDLLSNCNE